MAPPLKLVVTLPPPPKHTTMAPCNGTQQWPQPKLVVTLSPHYSTLQWHPTMAPSNGTTSTPLKLVVTLPPTIAHYNGSQQWQPAMAPRPRPPPLLEVRTPIAIAIWGKNNIEQLYNTICPKKRFSFVELPSFLDAVPNQREPARRLVGLTEAGDFLGISQLNNQFDRYKNVKTFETRILKSNRFIPKNTPPDFGVNQNLPDTST